MFSEAFNYAFNEYLLSAYYIPHTVFNPWGSVFTISIVSFGMLVFSLTSLVSKNHILPSKYTQLWNIKKKIKGNPERIRHQIMCLSLYKLFFSPHRNLWLFLAFRTRDWPFLSCPFKITNYATITIIMDIIHWTFTIWCR